MKKDSPWIDLTGSLDYLPLKKPIRVKRTKKGFYVKDFELTFPKRYNIEKIKGGITKKYVELLSQQAHNNPKNKGLWEKIIEEDIVDYDAFCKNLNKGHVTFFELRKRKNESRVIRDISSTKDEAIPKKYREYFQNLPLGWYRALIKYSGGGGGRINYIDEISPVDMKIDGPRLEKLLSFLK